MMQIQGFRWNKAKMYLEIQPDGGGTNLMYEYFGLSYNQYVRFHQNPPRGSIGYYRLPWQKI